MASGYTTVDLARFSGGLNLADGADSVAPDQAIDLLNVRFLNNGGVRQRDGYQRFSAAELTNRVDSIAAYYTSGGIKQLVTGNGNRLDALDTAGASIANVATGASPHSFARFGAPGSELLFIANGTDTVRQWNGAAFSTPVYTGTTPTGKLLAVQAADNRLVCARYPGFPDRVAFSDPGLPTTFTASSIIDLHPGSGEPITALVAWREYVFAFKETEFFVFYGTSTSSIGNPEFLYRPVSGGAGSLGAVAVAPEGVYFLDRRGIWLTTGGAAKLVSSVIDPIFLGGTSLYYQGGSASTAALANARMWWSQGRLYVAFAVGSSNDRVAVYSTIDGWWSLYDIPMSAIASFRAGTREELVFGYASGLKHVGRYFEGSGHAADELATNGTGGVAITSRWRQGWLNYNSPNLKQLRQTKLWGIGTAQVGVARDYAAEAVGMVTVPFSGTATPPLWDGAGVLWDTNVLWGPTAVTRPWLISRSVAGHVLSLSIQNNVFAQTWAVHRLTHGFRGERGPEVLGLTG